QARRLSDDRYDRQRARQAARPLHGRRARAERRGRGALPLRVSRAAGRADEFFEPHGRALEHLAVPLPVARRRFRARARRHAGAARRPARLRALSRPRRLRARRRDGQSRLPFVPQLTDPALWITSDSTRQQSTKFDKKGKIFLTGESHIGYVGLAEVHGGILNSQWLNLKSQSLLEHFGLSREPFNITPDPSFLYLSASHQQALARLVYGIDARKGFIVLTGEVGTGKTTLIHALLKELEQRNTQSTLIFNTISQSKDLLRDMCEDLGFTAFREDRQNVHTYLKLVNQLLLDSYHKGKNVTLILDEAQNLSPKVLESIRLLSNLETSECKLLQIVMAGQPELAVKLNMPSLRQLKQRVVLYHHLKPLNLAECSEYIARRVETAGGSPFIFTSKSLEAIHACSGGIPRLINILCDNGLVTAYSMGEKRVSAAIIRDVADDRSLVSASEEAARARGISRIAERPARPPRPVFDDDFQEPAPARRTQDEEAVDEHVPPTLDSGPD